MIDSTSKIGAGEAIRTPDPNLGKVELSLPIGREPATLSFPNEERASNGSRTRENVVPMNSQTDLPMPAGHDTGTNRRMAPDLTENLQSHILSAGGAACPRFLFRPKSAGKQMTDRKVLELRGDAGHREPVQFLLRNDGALKIWIDGGEGGDTEAGFYGIEAERTFSPAEVEQLRKFLA